MNPEAFRRIQELFHAALAREPDQREAFIRDQISLDEEMKEELLSLVRAHREADPFLESSLVEEDAPLRKGETIGPYRVLNEIGRGGMGIVYLAEDTRLSRQVALKALSPRLLSDPRQLERFRREAQVAGSLSHPSIATIYVLEEVEGRFYIVSEYVPGESLREEMNRGPTSPQRVLEIGLQLAEALASAHERGVVHRDLKPENIVRVNDSQVKIVDFGLALGPGNDVDQRLTVSGTLVGTLAYMSPEQLLGRGVDARSDLFSLGIVLYELTMGDHPFGGETPLGISARILESVPRRREDLRDRIPGLDQVILKCLEKSPASRYGSTPVLVAELRRLSTPAAELPPIRTQREEEETELRSHWWVVHQALVITLFTVMIILLFVANAGADDGLVRALSFLLLASGAGNGAIRAHLLFTSRFNRRAIRNELARIRPLIRGLDMVFTLILLAAAVVILPESQPWAAGLASVGVAYSVVALIVEPVTVRSVFSIPDPHRR